MQGKMRTAPNGTEMDELPFKRTRRLKNANRGDSRSVRLERSLSDGKLGAEGIRLVTLCTRSIGLIRGANNGAVS
jgi:hypothetical protein